MTKLTRETIEHGIRVFTAQQQDASMSVLLCEKMLAELHAQESKLPQLIRPKDIENVKKMEEIPAIPSSVR